MRNWTLVLVFFVQISFETQAAKPAPDNSQCEQFVRGLSKALNEAQRRDLASVLEKLWARASLLEGRERVVDLSAEETKALRIISHLFAHGDVRFGRLLESSRAGVFEYLTSRLNEAKGIVAQVSAEKSALEAEMVELHSLGTPNPEKQGEVSSRMVQIDDLKAELSSLESIVKNYEDSIEQLRGASSSEIQLMLWEGLRLARVLPAESAIQVELEYNILNQFSNAARQLDSESAAVLEKIRADFKFGDPDGVNLLESAALLNRIYKATNWLSMPQKMKRELFARWLLSDNNIEKPEADPRGKKLAARLIQIADPVFFNLREMTKEPSPLKHYYEAFNGFIVGDLNRPSKPEVLLASVKSALQQKKDGAKFKVALQGLLAEADNHSMQPEYDLALWMAGGRENLVSPELVQLIKDNRAPGWIRRGARAGWRTTKISAAVLLAGAALYHGSDYAHHSGLIPRAPSKLQQLEAIDPVLDFYDSTLAPQLYERHIFPAVEAAPERVIQFLYDVSTENGKSGSFKYEKPMP